MNRLLSGIKPTGQLHIGNYFGAIRQFVDLQEQYQPYVFIADLHALNQVHDAAVMREGITETLVAYLACGLDPTKTILFQQSAVMAHAQLCVILNSITSIGVLERSHAYKDALVNGKPANVGLFDYPVLMAADILLYDPEVVPVGHDQRQHLEIAVDLAQRFNHLFGTTFREPKALILDEVAVVPGIDGRKMSKSYSNTIALFEEEESLRRKVMSITTDSKRPEEPKSTDGDTLFALHRLTAGEQLPDLEQRYLHGRIGYKESKDILFTNINKMIAPLRQRKEALLADQENLTAILKDGATRANAIAQPKIEEVYARIGTR